VPFLKCGPHANAVTLFAERAVLACTDKLIYCAYFGTGKGAADHGCPTAPGGRQT